MGAVETGASWAKSGIQKMSEHLLLWTLLLQLSFSFLNQG